MRMAREVAVHLDSIEQGATPRLSGRPCSAIFPGARRATRGCQGFSDRLIKRRLEDGAVGLRAFCACKSWLSEPARSLVEMLPGPRSGST